MLSKDLDPYLDPHRAARQIFRQARAQIEASGLKFVGQLPPFDATSPVARDDKFIALAVKSGGRFTDITRSDLPAIAAVLTTC
jgi:hypothetical protein